VDQEASVILNDIGETRNALAEKLTLLEGQVKDTVQNAKASVEGTFETVRDTVNDTVESVKDSFSVKKRIVENPWTALGISVGTGFLFGRWLKNSPAPRYSERYFQTPSKIETAPTRERDLPPGLRESRPPESQMRRAAGFIDFLGEYFNEEIQMAKGMILTAAVEKVREVAVDRFPQIKDNLDEIVKSAEHKFAHQPKN
jgi:ElaB/YqjD/DUF883 family membrane-anchored ribosome-binding protein